MPYPRRPQSLLRRLSSLWSQPIRAEVRSIERIVRAWAPEYFSRAARYADPRCLTRYGYRCFSQNDEDGLIDEIFHRIGTTNRTFVEFGVDTGLENNSLALLLAGWNGLWIEASRGGLSAIQSEFSEPIASGQLTVLAEFVTAENIEHLLVRGKILESPDLLSIDIDGNDYWVWKAIRHLRPRLVVIEYNASLGRTARSVMRYEPLRSSNDTVRFGASLGALEQLGRRKGYSLVCCNITGVNAFFVRDDCVADRFLAPFTSERHYEPPRYGESGSGHRPRWGHFEPV